MPTGELTAFRSEYFGRDVMTDQKLVEVSLADATRLVNAFDDRNRKNKLKRYNRPKEEYKDLVNMGLLQQQFDGQQYWYTLTKTGALIYQRHMPRMLKSADSTPGTVIGELQTNKSKRRSK